MITNTPEDGIGGPGIYQNLDKLLGEQETPSQLDIPEEIVQVIEGNGLAGRSFRCVLKEVPDGATDGEGAYITSWSRSVPSLEWIALNYGPGSYLLHFQWRGKDQELDKMRNFNEKVPLVVSEKYEERFREYQNKVRLKSLASRRRAVENARIEKELDVTLIPDEKPDTRESAKKYLEEFRDVAQSFGWMPLASAHQSKGIGDVIEKIAPFIPVAVAWIQGQQQEARRRDEQFITLLSTMASSSNQQLIEVLKKQNGPSSGNDILKEMTNMIMGTLDLKEAISGNKKTALDKVLETVEGVLPIILTMAQQPRKQLEGNFMAKQAQQFINRDPAFQTVMKDPELLAEAVSHWDESLGWEQTDAVLGIAGMSRPESCPRDPAKKYPDGDERRGAVDAECSDIPGDQ